MFNLSGLSTQQLANLYARAADLMELVETLPPTQSQSDLMYCTSRLLQHAEARLSEIDPLPRRARSRKPASQSTEVK